MLGYQPNFRPVVRALAQAAPPPAPAPTVRVPAEVAAQTATAVSASGKNKTVALLASGLGAVGGGVAAYCSYMKGKKKVDTTVLVAGAFALINVLFFGVVIGD